MKRNWENYKIQHLVTIHPKWEDGNTMVEMEEVIYLETWWLSEIKIWVKCNNIFCVKENNNGEEQCMVEGEWDDFNEKLILF